MASWGCVRTSLLCLIAGLVAPSTDVSETWSRDTESFFDVDLSVEKRLMGDILMRVDMSVEKRLMGDILMRYARLGRDGRPVRNSSVPVKVQFGLGLIKMELHERENMLSLSTWARYRWRDEYLTWDPSQYGDTRSVKLTPEKIWIPDIMLYNTANTEESQRKVMAVVRYDGTVMWYPHKVFKSSCAIDVRHFPFDNQTCHMWFGSWTHTHQELDLELAFPSGIDLSTFKSVYKDVSEWDIYNISAERLIMPPTQPDSYAILSFTLFLRRKLNFSTYILTMPAIFLAFLTLLVFWLPPEHADKSALGLTIFGSLLLLLLILVEAAPPTASAVPLLGLYYCFTTVIVILSIFLSCLVVKIGRASDNVRRKRMPRWLRIVILQGLGRLVCMRYADSPCRCRTRPAREYAEGDTSAPEKEPLDHFCYREDPAPRVYPETAADDGKMSSSLGALSTIDRRLKGLTELLTMVIRRRNEQENSERLRGEIEQEWRHMAMVLDRFFFTCYLIVIVLSLVIFFPRRSYG